MPNIENTARSTIDSVRPQNVGIWLGAQKRLESSAEGRQRRCRRNLRWQAVSRPRVSNRKCSTADSGAVNRRLNEAVAAGRAKSSATWKVGNVGERSIVIHVAEKCRGEFMRVCGRRACGEFHLRKWIELVHLRLICRKLCRCCWMCWRPPMMPRCCCTFTNNLPLHRQTTGAIYSLLIACDISWQYHNIHNLSVPDLSVLKLIRYILQLDFYLTTCGSFFLCSHICGFIVIA